MYKKSLQSSNYFRHKPCGEFSRLISEMDKLRKTYAVRRKSATLWRKFGANDYQLANFIKKSVAFLAGWAIIISIQAHHASQRCEPRWVIFYA